MGWFFVRLWIFGKGCVIWVVVGDVFSKIIMMDNNIVLGDVNCWYIWEVLVWKWWENLDEEWKFENELNFFLL